MQDVNDDMDDLFRKAAEHYPLKTDGADWQKVFAGLQESSAPAAEEKEKKKRRALWLFWLLPLLLLGAAVYYKSGTANQSTQQIVTTKASTINSANNDEIKTETGDDVKNKTSKEFSQKQSAKVSDELAVTKENTSVSKPSFSSIEVTNGSTSAEKKSNEISKGSKSKDHKILAGKKDDDNGKSLTGMVIENGLKTSSIHSSFSKKQKEDFTYESSLANNNKQSNEITDNKKNLSTLQPVASSNRIDTKEEQTMVSVAEANKASENKTDSVAVNISKPDSAANNATSNESKKNLVKAKTRKQTGFYAGLMASFDASTIKLQRINKTGYGFDLLLGYRFSNRLSVESGINWTDKKYYSIGKYFDKTKTGISPMSKIIYTNGSCAMFEIPAVVKYDFAQKKKSNFFATAGLSSYIMKNEKYDYYANHSGIYYNATRKYSNSGSNVFSVVSLSIGCQLQINKHLSLRAEPYIKMPLNGIGIAKMPITSTGISVGFTRSF